MCFKLILDIFTAVGTVGAVIIAMVAMNKNDRNTKKQITTNKLEELLELVKASAKYYVILKDLNNDIINLHNIDYKELTTINQYFKIRDNKFPQEERDKMFDKLSRIEVLAKCYTSNYLKKEVLTYEDLLYTMTEKATRTGSITEMLNWKNGFPTYEEFHDILIKIEKKTIDQITK